MVDDFEATKADGAIVMDAEVSIVATMGGGGVLFHCFLCLSVLWHCQITF